MNIPPGFALHCGYCGKVMALCKCGTTPAGVHTPEPVVMVEEVEKHAPVVEPPTKPETWRDRPPLL